MSRSKYWCFTLNNYTNEEEVSIQNAYTNDVNHISYLVYGREVGENGTRHLQGYVEFSQRLRITQVKRVLGQRLHLEKRLGNASQADEYCKKDGDFVTYGEISVSVQGQRRDLHSLHESLVNNRPLRYIADEHFSSFIRYQRGILAARSIYSSPRNWIVSVIVYHGKTGLGKTRSVMDNLPSQDSVYIHPGGHWFDGYDNENIVLFDDFGGSEFKLTYLLKLLDRYPMRVPIKGGFVNWAPHEIYITSNHPPTEWYPNAKEEHVNALLRRITNTVEFL